MDKHANVVLSSVVLCDDVRKEESSKYILIGLYTNGPLIQQIPMAANFTILAMFRVEGLGEVDIQVKVVAPGSSGLGQIKAAVVEKGNTFEAVMPFPTLIDGPGQITFEWKNGEDDWQLAQAWSIMVEDEALKLDNEQAEAFRAAYRSMHPKPATEVE